MTFNDHDGSTKSYSFTREHATVVTEADFVAPTPEIAVSYEPGSTKEVRMQDGSVVRFRKVSDGFDALDRDQAYSYIRERQEKGEVLTGLLHISPDAPEMHDVAGTVETPLTELPYEALCPGSDALEKLQAGFR